MPKNHPMKKLQNVPEISHYRVRFVLTIMLECTRYIQKLSKSFVVSYYPDTTS